MKKAKPKENTICWYKCAVCKGPAIIYDRKDKEYIGYCWDHWENRNKDDINSLSQQQKH